MKEEQPQLFLVPAATLVRVVKFLGDLPFNQVAPLMSMIDNTIKEYQGEPVQRSKSQRNGRKSKSEGQG